ncbi:hypothetical protein JCM17380_10820 [Desulfosporosinus burensis]
MKTCKLPNSTSFIGVHKCNNGCCLSQKADKAYVMETGEITLHGEAKVLLHDERVRKAYLGE